MDCMLCVRSPHHERRPVLVSETSERAPQAQYEGVDVGQGFRKLHRQGGIHDVLRRRTPVEIACNLFATRSADLSDERKDRIPDNRRLFPESRRVDLVRCDLTTNRIRCLGGDDAQFTLYGSQAALDF